MTARTPYIRTQLVVLVLAGVLPAALMMFALIAYNYQRDRDQLEASTIATARALAATLDQRLAEIRSGLTVLSSSHWLDGPDPAQFHARATGVAQALRVTSIGLIDPQGNQVLNTQQPLSRALPPIGPSSQIRNIFKTGKPVLADLFMGPTTGKASVALGVPVERDGRVVFSVVAGIAPELLREVLLHQQLPTGWVAAIFDGNAVIAARTHDHERFVGTSARARFASRMKEVTEDAIDGVTVTGVPVLSAFSRAPNSQWTVAIGVPEAELIAELRRSLLAVVLGTALLLASGLALAWFRADRIVRSIRELIKQADALGRGQRAAPAAVDFSEAHLLGAAFERAASKLEYANAQLERRLQALLESAMDAVIAVDESQRVVVFNAAAAALFGYSEEEALGMPLDRLLSQRGPTDPGHWLDALLGPGSAPRVAAEELDLCAVRLDGTEFPVDVAVSSVREANALYHTIFVRDMTERHRARQALLRSNQELQQFAFVASHDLRSPLRSVKGYLGLLQTRYGAVLDDKAKDLIQRAGAAVDQLDGLTEDLLTYARLDTRPRSMAAVDTRTVVADSLRLLEAVLADTGACVHVGDLPTLRADRPQLVQLFQNLLGNALKYGKNGVVPDIQVRALRQPDQWLFSVADNGIGIEAQHHARIFEIFKRLHTQHEYAGSGIGLAICQRIVEGHGGRIWVVSEPGQGSTFFFTISDPKEPA